MIKSILDAGLVNKTKLSEELGYNSRGTLYSRLETPEKITVHEAKVMAEHVGIPITELVAILLNDREQYKTTINNIIKKTNGEQI